MRNIKRYLAMLLCLCLLACGALAEKVEVISNDEDGIEVEAAPAEADALELYGELSLFEDEGDEISQTPKAAGDDPVPNTVGEALWAPNAEGEDAVPNAAGVKIDATHFPDAIFREYVKSSFDKDNNGVLSSKEIKAAKKIYIEGLTSIEGIEYFTYLAYLDCSRGGLVKLNVSKNTRLEELYCLDNSIKKLDVSKNTRLKKLNCSSNILSKLDVRKNTRLEELDCGGNNLTSLDVRKNKELKVLDCGYNSIAKLDVHKNKKLKELVCPVNRLSDLDIHNNEKLEHIDCSNNKLTSLDVHKNKRLKSIMCSNNNITTLDISKNTRLEYLLCYNNKIKTLDTHNNTQLKRLTCYKNKIASLDILKNKRLEMLQCYDNKITSLDLSKCPSLVKCAKQGTRTVDNKCYLFYQYGALLFLQIDKATKVYTDVVSNVSITKGESATLQVGETLTLSATISPMTAAPTSLNWSTSNKKVATVSSKGLVTAKKAGTATITVKTKNGKKDTIKITVKTKEKKIELSKYLNKDIQAFAKEYGLTVKKGKWSQTSWDEGVTYYYIHNAEINVDAEKGSGGKYRIINIEVKKRGRYYLYGIRPGDGRESAINKLKAHFKNNPYAVYSMDETLYEVTIDKHDLDWEWYWVGLYFEGDKVQSVIHCETT